MTQSVANPLHISMDGLNDLFQTMLCPSILLILKQLDNLRSISARTELSVIIAIKQT